jgi:hypothetical protein
VSEPIFHRDGDAFVPTAHARGPWDPGAMHGGAPAALLATAIQALAPDMQVARLTYEFLGPVAIAPCTLGVHIAKPGKRFQLAEGELHAGGREAMRVRAVLLRRDQVDLPAIARWDGAPPGGLPADGRHVDFPGPLDDGFHTTGMEIRWVDGSIGEIGPAVGWWRLAHELVAGEPTAPVARVAAAADFSNGAGRVLGFDTHLFVNTDLSIHLVRDPAGEWVQLEASTAIDPSGVGVATSVLRDERGPIGHTHQTLFVAGR